MKEQVVLTEDQRRRLAGMVLRKITEWQYGLEQWPGDAFVREHIALYAVLCPTDRLDFAKIKDKASSYGIVRD